MGNGDRSTDHEPSITILHVSDMQFGRNHRFGRLDLGAADEQFDTLLTRLCDDLDELRRSEGLKPDLIALTGDLVEWGLKKEFDDVRRFAEGLGAHLGLSRERVLVVPGNHDINRKKCEGYFANCEGDGEKPVPPYWPKWAPYADFFHTLYKDVDRYHFTELEPWTLYELPEIKVVVAGMNSTMRESHREDDHYGWLGERQLRWFGDQLKPYGALGWLRVGLVHHNVLRHAVDDDENLRDADDLREHLADELDLLLHGHTHLGRHETLGMLPVFATGSAGVKIEQRPEEAPNQYQVVRVHRGGIWCGARQYTAQRKKWIGDTRVSKRGDAWSVEREVALHRARATFPASEGTSSDEREDPHDRIRGVRISDGRIVRDLLAQVIDVCEVRGESQRIKIERVLHTGPWGHYARVVESDGGTYVLGAVDGELTTEVLDRWVRDVHEPFRSRRSAAVTESWLVVDGRGPLDDALRRRAQERGVRTERLVDYQRVLDVQGYRDDLYRRLDADPVYPRERYLDQRAVAWNPGTLSSHDLSAAADWVVDRLRDQEGSFLLVLGQAGMGKTFLLREVARRLAEAQELVTPLLIDLRNLESAHDVPQLAAWHFSQRRLSFQPRAFERDLREGRVALLFDGFDELALRVKSSAIPAHFERIIHAARDRARVVVSCRNEHFLSRGQVSELMVRSSTNITSLGGALQTIARREILELKAFERADVERYLVRALGSKSGGDRFRRLSEVHDLVGLARNPRMLGFLVNIPDEKLSEAAQLKGAITSAKLYRIVIEDAWLGAEHRRLNPPGAAPGPTIEALRDAATRLALHLWTTTSRAISASELDAHVGALLTKVCDGDAERAAHTLQSRTLLVRDDAGKVSFIHQTVLEWLVACLIASEVESTGRSAHLGAGRLNEFMIDLLRELVGDAGLAAWAEAALALDGGATLAENAGQTLKRMGREARLRVDLRGSDLRGQDLGGRDLRHARLDGANLTGVRLVGRDLAGASLVGAKLADADLSGATLTNADLTGADLSFARLHRAEVSGLRLDRAVLRGASFLGAVGVRPSELVADPITLAQRTPCFAPSAYPCYSVAYSPDGRLLASGHDDGTVRLWDLTRGRLIRVLSGHTSRVRSVAWNRDGSILASASDDWTARLWRHDNGEQLRVIKGHLSAVYCVAWSHDGETLASGSSDKTVRLWKPDNGEQFRVLAGHAGTVSSVAWNHDGSVLASGSDDRTVRLWKPDDGGEVRVLVGHSNFVSSVAWNHDGSVLASGSFDDTVRLWRADDGKELSVLEGHSGRVSCVAWSHDGSTLASGSFDNTVRLWKADGGRAIHVIQGHSAHVLCLAWRRDGSTLASGSFDCTVRLWKADGGKELRILDGRTDSVLSIAWGHDGRTLASGSQDSTVRLWRPHEGRELRVLQGPSGYAWSVAWSPDGSSLASGSSRKTVRLWNPGDGKEIRTLEGHTASVLSVAWSRDGRTLASGSFDKTVRLWNPDDGTELRALTGHTDYVLSVAWSHDGGALASGSKDQTIRLWNSANGSDLGVLRGHSGDVRSVAWSHDGGTLASGSDDRTVRLWRPFEGEELRVLAGHSGYVFDVAWSPDGSMLASGSSDHTVRLWSPADGRELRVFAGHSGYVWNVAWNHDGSKLASGSSDNTVRIWEVATGHCLAIFFATDAGTVAFRPDGRYKVFGDVGGSFWHTIGLHRYEVGELDEFVPDLRMADDEAFFSAP